ncbi:phosphohistidine phosphatase SixA [Simiduia agarivorans]|uniref:Phosphohistidine phosphatase SixA n=1 Tax=Simiduia agarivorans (strain DSM 21679 / JCM 13881 / BCRC 17597 / SA1) TaxID=1117647 RepID=K4KER5_SIMAS|nr:phosphohistidine phosphatase SixA [Simiduia agarivorans]AFU97554.1 phosphohistidine phosphatase SixA [Simiduia agarivorans SA1 = DSM 21679]
MKLYVLRHGQAAMQAGSDFERPLTRQGEAQVAGQTEKFAGAWSSLSAVYVSPLVRGQQTAAVVAQTLSFSPGVVSTVEWLRPETPLAHVYEQLLHCTGDVLLISHQPLVSTLSAGLAGRSPWQLGMDTASVAVLEGDCVTANGMVLEAVYDAR